MASMFRDVVEENT